MAAITTTAPITAPQLRPLNIMHDLPAVADLVEKCFASTMDADGRRYLQQMRDAGRDNSFLRWADRAVDTVSMPLSGFVWEEDRQIIGNVSLIPYHRLGKRVYLIANVAVQPEHRRKGIGRALTVAAMQKARSHPGSDIWLHVRDDNPGAIALYLELGFIERARRTSWHSNTDRNASTAGLEVEITRRASGDWPLQQAWLKTLYPSLMNWYQAMPWLSMRPGLGPALYRLFLDYEVRHWTAHLDGKLAATLSWQPVYGQSDHLWAALPQDGSARALAALLLQARHDLAGRKTLTLDFPAGMAVEAIASAGFNPRRTLLWMEAVETSQENQRIST